MINGRIEIKPVVNVYLMNTYICPFKTLIYNNNNNNNNNVFMKCAIRGRPIPPISSSRGLCAACVASDDPGRGGVRTFCVV